MLLEPEVDPDVEPELDPLMLDPLVDEPLVEEVCFAFLRTQLSQPFWLLNRGSSYFLHPSLEQSDAVVGRWL